ncbi:uncharacterized protein C8R40DRAFT_1065231 [Lentinula edodes]|uniref:uncharacterized protein n=1 Tax=Lentinula edodes TaxID=5353 RepID=UPI001E8DCFC6|nr:uncharacterized protein C8R40DRAFT_1065231 [Lentinula edodes]KAH7881586.1 hypothetical protein C8R40DRAFT_1065231 [Lentinula edodes]
MKDSEIPHIIGRKRQDLHPHIADDGSEIAQEKEYSMAKRFKDMLDLPSTGRRRFRNSRPGRLEYFRASTASSDVRVHEHGPAFVEDSDFGVALQAGYGSNIMFEESYEQVRHDPESRHLDTQPLICLDDEMQPFPSSGFDRIGEISNHTTPSVFDQVRGFSETDPRSLPLPHDEIQFSRTFDNDSIAPHAQSSDDVSQQGIAQNESQESVLPHRDGGYFTQPAASLLDYVTPDTFDRVQGNPELESSPLVPCGVYDRTSGFDFGSNGDDVISLDDVAQNESYVGVWKEGEGVAFGPHCDQESYAQTHTSLSDQAISATFDQTQAGYHKLESLFPPVSSRFTIFDRTQADHPGLESLPPYLSSGFGFDSNGVIHTESIDHASQTGPDVGVELHRQLQPDISHITPNTCDKVPHDPEFESPLIPFVDETQTSSSLQSYNDGDLFTLVQSLEDAPHTACSDLHGQITDEENGGSQSLGHDQNEFQLQHSNASLSIEPGTFDVQVDGSYADAGTVFYSHGAEPSYIQPETQAHSDHACHDSALEPDSSYVHSDSRTKPFLLCRSCLPKCGLRPLCHDDAETSSFVRSFELNMEFDSGMSIAHQHDSGAVYDFHHEMPNAHGDDVLSLEHSQHRLKDGAVLDSQNEKGISAPGPHYSEATFFHPKKSNGSDNGDGSFSRDTVPSYCTQPEGERTSDYDIVCSDASAPSSCENYYIQSEDKGSLDYIQPFDAEVNECFQEQLDVSDSLPDITLEGPSSETDQDRTSKQSSPYEREGLPTASYHGIGSDTPSFLDMPVAFGVTSACEEPMDVQLNLDDTEFDADDEGVKDDAGDLEMEYEYVRSDLDISMADNGNGTQTFADHNNFKEVPPTPISPYVRTHEHHLQCVEESKLRGDPHRRTTQTTADNNYLGVPLTSIQGDTSMSGPRGARGVNYQQGTPPLSPLSEIPDTPMVADTSAEDEMCLRTELESLINNNVKSVSMKSHFRSQMNQHPFDKTKIRSLLDSCYHYVGVLTNCNPPPPSPDIPVDTSHLHTSPKPKLYKPPQHRPQSKVDLAEYIRYEMGVLLGRVNDQNDPEFVARPLSTVPSTTIDSWRRGGTDGPTLENFILQLCDGKHTHWNKAAAQVFSIYIRSKEEYKDYAIKSVQEAFFAHLSQLKKDFELQGRPKTIDEKDSEQRMRRMRRRNAELHRRISSLKTILARYPIHISKELHEMHKYITVECISGDESEPGPEATSDKIYYRTNRAWISQQFADFLYLLRAWHIGSRYLGGGKYSNGRFPHPRYPSSRPESMFDSDIAPRGLPRNWYNPAWLMRNPSRMEILAVGPDVPLTLPQEEVRCISPSALLDVSTMSTIVQHLRSRKIIHL